MTVRSTLPKETYAIRAYSSGMGGMHDAQLVGMRDDGVPVVWCATCGLLASGYDSEIAGEAAELLAALRDERHRSEYELHCLTWGIDP